jgi:hypothetical protein
MSTSTETQIGWHNDTTVIVVEPVAEAPEAFAVSVELTLMAGRTVVDGDKVKRPAWRVKAIMDGAEFVEANALKAVNVAIRARFAGTKYHDVKAALIGFSLPELQAEDTDKPDSADWTKFANAGELIEERDAASDAATVFFKGESDMRAGLKELGMHIAAVAVSLEKPAAFTAWRDSGSDDLKKALANKNSKSELIFVGKLPADWFALQPETSNSAKAYQRNFNINKNDIAGALAREAWGKKKAMPKAAQAQSDLFKSLESMTGVDGERTAQEILAMAFFEALTSATEGGDVMLIAEGEKGLEPAKDGSGKYIAGIQFGTGNRPNELLAAFCNAMAAAAPEARAEAEERRSESEAAAAVKPRTFAEYGVSEAAMHLARILSSRDDWADVLDALDGMADRADKETWEQVLSDVKEGVNAAKAEVEAATAEETADDDA